MPKRYDIEKIIKDDKGVIISIATTGGTIKTKRQVINDINNGYNVTSSGTKMIVVDNDYVRNVANGNETDNLSN